MIFILKREAINKLYEKYLEVRNRLPKNPITSITELTSRVTQRRSNAIPIRTNAVPMNAINSNRLPFPKDENENPLPFPRESVEAPLAGNQSTSQISTPRAIQTRSAYM